MTTDKIGFKLLIIVISSFSIAIIIQLQGIKDALKGIDTRLYLVSSDLGDIRINTQP